MDSPQVRLTAALADRYRIERELGQGGMATVYLAEDLKHGRRVALKVLHPELAAVLGGERFLAEIKTTAHLQHPNILQLFDSGSADGLLYYVMPFVEGESLRLRLSREKQLPIDTAVAIARGAAAALDYAHRHGVIHRDIKPENILLQDGQPLVADFGIALAVKHAGGARLTQTGLSLGTPQYMSPEQATGERELDARSDIYALGAVAYEMLTGEAPFTGSTTQAIIAKLMTEEPRPLSVLRRTVPPHVESAVHRAMEKLPADRFESAGEFGAALEGKATAGYLRTTAARAIPGAGGFRPARLIAAAVILAGGSLLLGRWSVRREPVSATPSRLGLLPPENSGIVNAGLARILDVSQDGQTIVFAANGTATDFVAVARLDEGRPTILPGSDGVRNLRISPDGHFVYSTALGGSSIQRAPIGGGSWTPNLAVPTTSFISWAADGSIWWSPLLGGGLFRARPGAETSEHVFKADSSGTEPVIQQVLPGDRRALVVATAHTNSGQAGVFDLQKGTLSPLFDFPVVEIRYTAGTLVYARPDNTLWAAPFDPGSAQVTGPPVQLAANVALTGSGVAQFAVSSNGTVIYLPTFGRELVLVDRNGRSQPISDAKLNYHSPRFSPDGRRISLDNVGADGRDVWIWDREQKQLTRATFDRDGHDATWSSDGKALYYASQRRGAVGIYRVRPGAGSSPDSILAHRSLGFTGVALKSGALITSANDMKPGSGSDVVLIKPDQPRHMEPLFATSFDEGWAVASPDEKWLAFTSEETGKQEVYVSPLSGDGFKVQVSVDGGSEPVWAPSGRELFYRGRTGGQVQFMAAEVQPGAEFRVLRRTMLFDASDYEPAQPHANYDVAPDGKSFVMLRRAPSSHIVVIQNLPALMRKAQRQP